MISGSLRRKIIIEDTTGCGILENIEAEQLVQKEPISLLSFAVSTTC